LDFGSLWGIFSPLCLSNPIQWTLFLSVPKNDLEKLGAGVLQILSGNYYKTESGQQIGYCYENGPIIIYNPLSLSLCERSLETVMHLFVECLVSRTIWSGPTSACGATTKI
jgi:hypothetical protein